MDRKRPTVLVTTVRVFPHLEPPQPLPLSLPRALGRLAQMAAAAASPPALADATSSGGSHANGQMITPGAYVGSCGRRDQIAQPPLPLPVGSVGSGCEVGGGGDEGEDAGCTDWEWVGDVGGKAGCRTYIVCRPLPAPRAPSSPPKQRQRYRYPPRPPPSPPHHTTLPIHIILHPKSPPQQQHPAGTVRRRLRAGKTPIRRQFALKPERRGNAIAPGHPSVYPHPSTRRGLVDPGNTARPAGRKSKEKRRCGKMPSENAGGRMKKRKRKQRGNAPERKAMGADTDADTKPVGNENSWGERGEGGGRAIMKDLEGKIDRCSIVMKRSVIESESSLVAPPRTSRRKGRSLSRWQSALALYHASAPHAKAGQTPFHTILIRSRTSRSRSSCPHPRPQTLSPAQGDVCRSDEQGKHASVKGARLSASEARRSDSTPLASHTQSPTVQVHARVHIVLYHALPASASPGIGGTTNNIQSESGAGPPGLLLSRTAGVVAAPTPTLTQAAHAMRQGFLSTQDTGPRRAREGAPEHLEAMLRKEHAWRARGGLEEKHTKSATHLEIKYTHFAPARFQANERTGMELERPLSRHSGAGIQAGSSVENVNQSDVAVLIAAAAVTQCQINVSGDGAGRRQHRGSRNYRVRNGGECD
ncbi:hypothetical protein DFH08DRAFT_825414 [Mycena albidolilacea]|uniref:Uncharacterized protein n=1 Tax=Mycena albidolilacea TaxID=1033008 RepID=A0AAD6Z361_9AGAR|nr:hypothetical protein DFH08DRAFT_825414 [Mycena albidolilacea]